jgi:putative endonuclease
MTNKPFGTLYIGVTGNIEQRIRSYKFGLTKGFVEVHKLYMLVHYEEFNDVTIAIQRETSLKRWYRDWKIDLINEFNPEWKDLAESIGMDARVKPEHDTVICPTT